MFEVYLEVFYPLQFRTSCSCSLDILGYHWLPLVATTHLVSDNREFEAWGELRCQESSNFIRKHLSKIL